MKKLAVQLIKELTSLADTIPAGFKGLFAKSGGLFWKNSDGTEKQIITNDLVNQDVRTTATPTFETITANKITGVKSKLNTVSSNLGNPTVEEMALFHGQFNNKMRFVPPYLQEESTDGITWVTSNRATENNLADLMLGEGNTTSVNILPLPTVGSSAYYRLSWNLAEVGYVYLNTLYLYLSSSGNNVNIKIEKYNILNNVWTDVALGVATGWPNHTYIPHTTIPFYPTYTISAAHFGIVRVTFSVVSCSYANTIPLYAIEWFGGYPAGRRNLESVDRYKNVYFPKLVISNETINFDASIEPTQTGASVIKTSTWMWQYLAQGIKWLKANFANYSLTTHNHTLSSLSEKSYNSLTDKPTIPAAQVQTDWNATTGLGVLLNKPASLPANGGDADTVNGLNASAFAKADTAFTSYSNILNNNAECAIFVVDSSPNWSSVDIPTLISNDISQPQNTTSMYIVLQPGVYTINSALDFISVNIKGIIGLSKESTIIEVADTGLIINLETIENVTIKLMGNGSGTLFSSDLRQSEAKNLNIVYDGNLGYDLEATCFNCYSLLSDISIFGIVGICRKSSNIDNIVHDCSNINNYSGLNIFETSENITNVFITQSTQLCCFYKSINISNIKILILSISKDLYITFKECTNINNALILNSLIAFYGCTGISNIMVDTYETNSLTEGFSSCENISNSVVSAYYGVNNSKYISNVKAESCEYGFNESFSLSTCVARVCNAVGFESCIKMVNNHAESNTTNYSSCYADGSNTYPVADTPNGGFNS